MYLPYVTYNWTQQITVVWTSRTLFCAPFTLVLAHLLMLHIRCVWCQLWFKAAFNSVQVPHLGGMSEYQCGSRAPLAMGVVMRHRGAVAGARWRWLPYHASRVQGVLQDGGRSQSVRVVIWSRVDQTWLGSHPWHHPVRQHCLDVTDQRHEGGAHWGRCAKYRGRS